MKSLLLNLLVAVIWLLLHDAPSLRHFAFGFALGFLLLALFRQVLGSQSYVRRMLAGLRFSWVFGKAFVLSCGELIRTILFVPVSRLRPAFIEYDVSALSKGEILLLSHCISLTPGTNTVDVAPDFSHLKLHVLDCPDVDEVRRSIDETLRKGILAFTR
jgi:multisubunit Na+/H+ antiporter MnhE subunit